MVGFCGGHLSSVRRVTFNQRTKQFISVDEHCLKAWTLDHDKQCRAQHDVQFPNYQSNFITSIVLSQELGLLFCACLDDNLRLYNERLRLKSSMPWSNGVVREVWECLLDYEAFRLDKTSDLFDVPKVKDGSVLPWCFGKYQHVRLRHTLNVPGARVIGATAPTGGDAAALAAAVGGGGLPGGDVINAPWCDRITLHEPAAMVLAMFEGHVYGFDVMSGNCLLSYTGLYDQPVTSCVFVPESDQLFTTAMDTCAMLWRVPRGCEAQRFKQFGRTAAPLTLVLADPDGRHVLTTSLDGSVTLWDMDTLTAVFKMKLSKTPVSTSFYKPNCFFMATDTELDASDTIRLDKSVVTTMPQLTSTGLAPGGAAVTVSLPAARLFALLADGGVHVWQLHLRRPPSFVAAWTHLAREGCCSLAHLDGGSLPPAVAERCVLPYDSATGVTRDHLALGTASGDCILVDSSSGAISFRFPAFKHQPLQLLAADLDRGVLVTVSRNVIKIWNMADVRCMHELQTSRPVSRLELLEGRAIAGTVTGSVHVAELHSGAANAASVTADHLDAVTGLATSVHLQHMVTGSRDSHIKVFDRDKRFKRSIYLGAPVSAVAYLNDAGDILVAMGQRLVVVRAAQYDNLAGGKESMYDDMRGSGVTPRALLRAMQSRMQRLSKFKVPLQVYAAAAAPEAGALAGDGSGSGVRRTPPLRRQGTPTNAPEVLLSTVLTRNSSSRPGSQGANDSHSGGMAAGQNSWSGGAIAGLPRASVAGGAGGAGGANASLAGERPPSSLKGALRNAVALDAALQGGQRPVTRESASRGGNRSVQWGAGGPDGAAAAAGATGTGNDPAASADGATAPGDAVDSGASVSGEAGAAAVETAAAPAPYDPEAAARAQSEDEEEGHAIAREMFPLVYSYNLHKEKMRIDRLLHGLPSIHQKMGPGGLPPGMAPQEPVPMRPSSRAGSSSGGAPGSRGSSRVAATAMRLNSMRSHATAGGGSAGKEEAEDEEEDGDDEDEEEGGVTDSTASASASDAEAPATSAGLTAAFRRTLPVIASPSAFFDGHIPPEALAAMAAAAGKKKKVKKKAGPGAAGAAGAGGEAGAAAGEKKKKKKKKKRRRRKVMANTDPVDILKSRQDYEVRAEIKAYEKHMTVQRLATATFLPRLGPPSHGPSSGHGAALGGTGGRAAAATAAAAAAAAAASGLDGGTVTSVTVEMKSAGSTPRVGTADGAGGAGGGAAPAGAATAASAAAAAAGGTASMKSLIRNLGVRGNVADLARMIDDPRSFIVAQQQPPGGAGGAGAIGLGPPAAGGGGTGSVVEWSK
eukprot:XP_001701723.1 predicted protein [Chlamydomonas reinhardtii]